MTSELAARLENGFVRVLLGVQEFGTALGAMDHGGPWERIEEEAHETMRRAFADIAELQDYLPRLAAKLASGASVADDGAEIKAEVGLGRRRVRAALKS